MATQPAKRRSPKAKQPADAVIEAEVVETATPAPHVDMAMPPPTVAQPAPKTPPPSTDAPKPEAPVTQPQAERSQPAPISPAAPEKRKSVFLPMVLGGLIAGGIGYGTAYMQFGQIAPVDLSGVQSQIDALRADVASLPPPDLSGVTQDITDLSNSVEERFAALNDTVAQVGDQAPVMDQQAQDQAVAQLSEQIASQQTGLAEQQAALEQQRADLQAQLDATRAEAEQIQQDAVDVARTETARAALARVQGAIESGAPMQAALDDLANAMTDPVPAALTALAEGAPTLATLRETFPEASRTALAAARSAGEAGDDTGALGSFLRNQLNVRSVAPRDGTDADATLSRAEDALRNGRLNDTLAEIATLPDSARAAMSDWISQAEARAAAVDAADQLDASLTAN